MNNKQYASYFSEANNDDCIEIVTLASFIDGVDSAHKPYLTVFVQGTILCIFTHPHIKFCTMAKISPILIITVCIIR